MKLAVITDSSAYLEEKTLPSEPWTPSHKNFLANMAI